MPPLIGNTKRIEQAFALLRERYAELGVDVEQALGRLVGIAVSLHCWQGDDVGGFEDTGAELGGGLTVTGSYPGKARTPDELRSDLDLALSLISGRHPLNRVAAWVIGARSLLKALRMVLLEPIAMLHEREAAGDFTARLAWLEEVKTLPFGAVWDYHCLRQDVSVGGVWLDAVRAYERDILARRQ